MMREAATSWARKCLDFLLSMIREIAKGILTTLDWLVDVTERMIVLGIAYGIIYTGWHLLRGNINPSLQGVLIAIPNHWTLLLILLIPLFYRAIRIMLRRIRVLPGGVSLDEEKRETEREAEASPGKEE